MGEAGVGAAAFKKIIAGINRHAEVLKSVDYVPSSGSILAIMRPLQSWPITF
jgi:hypothetical protein